MDRKADRGTEEITAATQIWTTLLGTEATTEGRLMDGEGAHPPTTTMPMKKMEKMKAASVNLISTTSSRGSWEIQTVGQCAEPTQETALGNLFQ